jgi:hypothetical protein
MKELGVGRTRPLFRFSDMEMISSGPASPNLTPSQLCDSVRSTVR